jgi:putative transposase
MPSRNLEKIYIGDSFYHIYNRGLNKQDVFIDNADYAVFLNLLKRYLSDKSVKDNKGREYESLNGKAELLAFCILPNHFHLLVYQSDPEAITRLLRGVATSYVGYFNKKYRRSGPLFGDRFKASMINDDRYLTHISRYIHLNPPNYKKYEWSSLPYYLGKREASWIKPEKIIGLFNQSESYLQFLADYADYKKTLDSIKWELADS